MSLLRSYLRIGGRTHLGQQSAIRNYCQAQVNPKHKKALDEVWYPILMMRGQTMWHVWGDKIHPTPKRQALYRWLNHA